jgi:hypothetical protein
VVEDTDRTSRVLLEKKGPHQEEDILEKCGVSSETGPTCPRSSNMILANWSPEGSSLGCKELE